MHRGNICVARECGGAGYGRSPNDMKLYVAWALGPEGIRRARGTCRDRMGLWTGLHYLTGTVGGQKLSPRLDEWVSIDGRIALSKGDMLSKTDKGIVLEYSRVEPSRTRASIPPA